MMRSNRVLAGLLLAASLAGGAAHAAEMKMMTELKASEEVPPTDSKGTGMIEATYDDATKKLTWKTEYSGLTGDPTAAHFHGPAGPGENAKPAVPLPDPMSGATGSAELTDAQAADLMAGKWYFNVHTAAHPDGELRGQIAAAK